MHSQMLTCMGGLCGYFPSTLNLKQHYVDASILITPMWDLKFHIDTNTSNIEIDIMLAKNPTWKCDKLIEYMFYTIKFFGFCNKNLVTCDTSNYKFV